MLSEFERRAWATRTSATQHPPAMACKAVADQIERGELPKIRHVIVVAIEDVGDGDRVHVIQAGDMSQLAAEGALGRATRVSWEQS